MQILGWAGFAKVDGVTFNWLGVPGVAGTTFNKATQKSLQVSIVLLLRIDSWNSVSVQFTSTQSIFVMTVGPVDLTVTFLSPVEVRRLHTTPFTYCAVF